MKKHYRVWVREIHARLYSVHAENEEEAKDRFCISASRGCLTAGAAGAAVRVAQLVTLILLVVALVLVPRCRFAPFRTETILITIQL